MFSTFVTKGKKLRFPIPPTTIGSVLKEAERKGPILIYDLDVDPVIEKEFGKFYEPTHIEIEHVGNVDVFGLAGKLVWEWWTGGTPNPPEVNIVIKEGGNPKVDTSGCRLAFLHAMSGILKAHIDRRQKAEEARHDPGEHPPPEPEGLMLKDSVDDSKLAINNLEACLKKGKTTPEAIQDIIVDEAKSAVKDVVKSLFKSSAPLKTFGANTKSVDHDYGKKFVSMRDIERQRAVKIVSEINGYAKDAGSVYDDFKVHMSSTLKLFDGMTKEYREIVKDSDGLTSLRPQVVKFLEKARDFGSSDDVKKALDELKAQRDDVKKKGGAGAETFVKEIKEFEKKWLL